MTFDLRHGDCLELMAGIPDGSVDMILCDLPYGTTACKWDTVIPFEPLWAHYRRVAKRNAAIVLTASQPFTAALVMSNPSEFRYCWVWEKPKASNFLLARKQPLKAHEDIAVFCQQATPYFPQMAQGEPYFRGGIKTIHDNPEVANTIPGYHSHIRQSVDGKRFPRTVQKFTTAEREGRLHPTQKPVALMEYLVRTYTREGETVLDNCMGSGTTGVACANTGRQFIGIEREPKYFEIARERIARATEQAAA